MALIEMRNISLSYPIIGAVDLSLKSSLRQVATGGRIQRAGRRSLQVAALDDINLTLRDGERLGLIGRNGAGKTTLLKVMSGIYRAQSGSFRRVGRLATVISPRNGLRMDISGYENIENMGLLSGLTRQQIRSKIPDIEDFTELGDFLALSVGTYSAGMMARLAFAVATALSPEILLLDENLATGDAAFVARAKARVAAMMERSNILVLATHAMAMLPRFVDRAILLDHGRIIADGPVDEVISEYKSSAGAAAPAKKPARP